MLILDHMPCIDIRYFTRVHHVDVSWVDNSQVNAKHCAVVLISES